MSEETEEWRKIPGSDPRYEVSNLGRMRSFTWGRMKILKCTCAANGYPRVSISCGKLGVRYANVHRYVMEAFVGIDPRKPCVNHIDGNKQNNKLSNLEWVTQSENCLHKYRIGRGVSGNKHWGTKVSDEDILVIRKSSEHVNILAERYGVGTSHIRRVRSGRLRKMAWGGPVEPRVTSLMETEWLLIA
jgi:hypothetical protein